VLFTSVIPTTPEIVTKSPFSKPCELDVTTAGLAFVIAVIVLLLSTICPLSLKI
jgi:hypothetical protein